MYIINRFCYGMNAVYCPCADDSRGGYVLARESYHQQEHKGCHADCWQVLGGPPQGSAGRVVDLCTEDNAQAHDQGMPVLGDGLCHPS